eukprot:jgi/Mesvir1/9839/Mv22382-RA.1
MDAGQESAKYSARVTVPFRASIRAAALPVAWSPDGSAAGSSQALRRLAGIFPSAPQAKGREQRAWPRWPLILAVIAAVGIIFGIAKYVSAPAELPAELPTELPAEVPDVPPEFPPPPPVPSPPAPVHYECLDGPHTGTPCCKADWSYLILLAGEGTSTRPLLLLLRRMLRAQRPTVRMCLDGNLLPESDISARDFGMGVVDHFDFGCPGLGTTDGIASNGLAEAKLAEAKARVLQVAPRVQPAVAQMFPEECHFLNVRYDYSFIDDVVRAGTKNGGLNVLLPLRHPIDRVVASFQEWERLVYGEHVPGQVSVTGLLRFSSGAVAKSMRKWADDGGVDRKPDWMPKGFRDLTEIHLDGAQLARFAAEGPNYMTRLLAGAVTGPACRGVPSGGSMTPAEMLEAAKERLGHMCLLFVDSPEMGVEHLMRQMGLEGPLAESDDDGGAGGKHRGPVSTHGPGGVLSRDILDVIADDNALDMQLYQYAGELFQRTHASYYGERPPEVPGSNCLREVDVAEAKGEPVLTPEAWASLEVERVQAARQRRRSELAAGAQELPHVAVYTAGEENHAKSWSGATLITKAEKRRPDAGSNADKHGPMQLWRAAARKKDVGVVSNKGPVDDESSGKKSGHKGSSGGSNKSGLN